MVFEDSELRVIGCAFDRAWDRVLGTGILQTNGLSVWREGLARQILSQANAGELDEWRLARNAVFVLWEQQFGCRPPVVGERVRIAGDDG